MAIASSTYIRADEVETWRGNVGFSPTSKYGAYPLVWPLELREWTLSRSPPKEKMSRRTFKRLRKEHQFVTGPVAASLVQP